MAKKRREPAVPQPAEPVRVWAPATVLLAAAAAWFLWSAQDAWFTERAAWGAAHAIYWAFEASAALALALASSGRLRAAAQAHLRRPAERGTHALWLAGAYAGLAALLVGLKYFQFRSGQLPSDTSAILNVAWNFTHGGTLASSVLGVSSYFSVHFMPLLPLLSPLVLLPSPAFAMLAAQALVVASIPIAVYALAFRRSGSAAAACAGLALALASPLYLSLARASLAPQACLPAFLLWALYCAESRRPALAGALFVLAACCIEQAPFTFFGLGLYLAARGRRAAGLGVCAASVLLWAGEMRLIGSYPDRFNDNYWSLFSHLGATPAEAAKNALLHPFAAAAQVLWPPSKLAPLWSALWTTGLLPLLAPLEALVFAACFLPHLLARSGDFYHDLAIHYPAYVLGPLFWALAAGLARAHGALARAGRGAWVLPGAFAVAAAALWRAPLMLEVNWNPQFFYSMPFVAPRVPPQASVWAVEYGAPWLAARGRVKIISGLGTVESPRGLFRPDYVLLDPAFVLNRDGRPGRARLFSFLQQQKYALQLRTETMYLMRDALIPKGGFSTSTLDAVIPDSLDGGLEYSRGLASLVGKGA